jgi:hypothetical protein
MLDHRAGKRAASANLRAPFVCVHNAAPRLTLNSIS